MFILKKGHQPGVYVPLRALFLVLSENIQRLVMIFFFFFFFLKNGTFEFFGVQDGNRVITVYVLSRGEY